MAEIPTWLPVVALALQRQDGCWLMHRRPEGKHHAGLWEFPGGKVEPNEKPKESLVREIAEETGICVQEGDLLPAGFADGGISADGKEIVILLYKTAVYSGEPVALEGGELGWFEPEAVARLDKPPLDIALARVLFGDGYDKGVAKLTSAP